MSPRFWYASPQKYSRSRDTSNRLVPIVPQNIAHFPSIGDSTMPATLGVTFQLLTTTISSRRHQASFDQYGQMFMAISQNIDTLRENNIQTSEIPTPLPTTSEISPDQALEKVLDQAASHITNPYMRSGFKRALESAIRQTQDEFGRDRGCHSGSRKPPTRQSLDLTTSSSNTTKTLFGDITIQVNEYATSILTDQGFEDLEHLAQSSIRVIFRPAAWLGLLRSSQTWKTTFQVFQPVPDDSPIFTFCRSGNIEGIQMLLTTKRASVWDTNSRGYTPLHVSIGLSERCVA